MIGGNETIVLYNDAVIAMVDANTQLRDATDTAHPADFFDFASYTAHQLNLQCAV